MCASVARLPGAAFRVSVVAIGLAATSGASADVPAQAAPLETGEATEQETGEPQDVEPPHLLQSHDAPYPPAARQAGLEAEVELELVVDANGNVVSSVVVKPAGHGFDEAAQQASLRFRFSPARRDGRAVASRIRYHYLFRIAPAASEPKPAGTQTGQLRGQVVTGSPPVPVTGAVVLVTLPDSAT